VPRRFLQLAAIAVAIWAVGFYWNPQRGDAIDQSSRALMQSLPKTYLINTRSMQYAEDGSLAEIVESERAEQFEQRGVTTFSQPRFYAHHGDDQTWSARADRGQLHHASQVLTMSDNVLLTADQRQAQLATQEMSLNLEHKTARSEVEVTITQGDNVTRADGMAANLPAQRVELKPNVESIYVLPRS
jgi:lipopolysaccharide export system protein LptC